MAFDRIKKLKNEPSAKKNASVNEEKYKHLEKTWDNSTDDGTHSPKRDAVPAIASTVAMPADAKCRAGAGAVKCRQVRVRIARMNFENYRKKVEPAKIKLSATKRKLNTDANILTKIKKSKRPSAPAGGSSTAKFANLFKSPDSKADAGKAVTSKTTATKPQQKFDASPSGNASALSEAMQLQTKRCVVRIKKVDLDKVKTEFENSPMVSPPKGKNKSSYAESLLKRSRGQPPKAAKESKKIPVPKEKKVPLKVRKSGRGNAGTRSGYGVMAASKFSRAHLIRKFGYRFFQCQVKIKKSKHPVILAFEAKQRERLASAKTRRSGKCGNI